MRVLLFALLSVASAFMPLAPRAPLAAPASAAASCSRAADVQMIRHGDKLKKLSRMFVQKTYGRNYVVFSQSQPANSFYIVCKGDFQVSIKTA